MSFVEQDDIISMIEQLFIEMSAKFSDKQISSKPFPRITYAEAMDKYGNDRPDLRFGIEFQNVTSAFTSTGFQAFAGVVAAGGQIKAIVVPGCGDYTRREIDELTELAKRAGAKGLATIALTADGVKSPIAKFLTEAEIAAITTGIGANTGDLVLMVADQPAVVAKSLSALRDELGQRLDLADPNALAYCWVYRVPAAGMGRRGQPLGCAAQPVLRLLRGGRANARLRSRQRSAPSSTTWCGTATRSAAASSAIIAARIRRRSSS